MRGVGTATAAITYVNALATGSGCAAAVTLPVSAEVELRPLASTTSGPIAIDPACDTPLTRATLLEALRRYGAGEEYAARLSVRSDIPAARGLKSSSAVSGAILRAVLNAFRLRVPSEEIARVAADVAREIGLSATGAFDDALAAIEGGVVLTDNRSQQVLRRSSPDVALRVVLWIPRSRHLPSTGWNDAFVQHAAEGRAAVAAALAGRFDEAMTRNTELVERVVGYEYRPLREELRRQGAAASGVSGMGPTLATLVRPDRVPAVSAALPREGAEILTVYFRPSGPLGPGSRR